MIALVRLFRPKPDQHDDRVPSSFMKLEKRTVLSVNGTFVAGTLNVDITAGGTETASLRAELDSSSNPTGNFFLDENDNGVWDSSSEVRDAFANLRQVVVNGFNSVGPISSGGTFNWFGDFSTAPLNAPTVDVIDINNVANVNFDATSTINASGSVNIDSVATTLSGKLSLTGGGSLTITDTSTSSSVSLAGSSVINSANLVTIGVGSFDQDAGASLTATGTISVEVDTTANIDGIIRSTNGSVLVKSFGNSISLASTGELISDVSSVKVQTVLGGNILVDGVINGHGSTLLESALDVVVNNQIRSNGGDLTIFASDDIVINYTAAEAVDSDGGSVLLLAQNFVNSGNDGIIMASGSLISGGTGNVILAAFDSSIQLARVDGSGVGLLASNAITDANDSITPNTVNVVATRAVLQANTIGGSEVGNPDPSSNFNAIDTQVDTLALNTVGAAYVRETDGLTINSVNVSAVRVNFVGGNGFASISLPNVFSSSGAIKLQSVTGDIVVNASVVTLGSSDVLLETLAPNGDIVANQTVSSRGGDVNLRAGDDVDLNANVSTTGQGSIQLVASNGAADAINGVDMSSSTVVSGAANVRIVAQNGGDILLSRVNSGSVSLIAANNIVDNNDAVNPNTLNVQATRLQMVATNGLIGNSDTGNPNTDNNVAAIDTQVTTIAASSSNGIYIRELDGVTVDTVTTLVSNVLFRSTEDAVTDTIEDLSTLTGGPIKLQSVAGSITVNAGAMGGSGVSAVGVGVVLLQTLANNGDIIVNGDITVRSTSVNLRAGDDIDLNANVTLTAGSTIHIQALNNNNADANSGVDMSANAVVSGGNGTVRIDAQNNGSILLSRVNATRVSLIAGQDIVDNNGNELNVQANILRMSAGGTIGGSQIGNSNSDLNDNAIDTQIATLSAQATTGIYIEESDGMTIANTGSISVFNTFFQSTNNQVVDADLSDLTTTTGPIKIKVNSGSLTVTDGADADGIGVTSASGDVLLWSENGLTIQARVVSSGDVTFRSSGTVHIAAAGSLESGDTGLILANTLTYAGTISASNGIAIQTATDLTVTGAITSANGSIGLISTGGSVVQSLSLTSAVDLYVGAAQNYTMTSGTAVNATGNVVIDVDGNVNLRQLTANHVAINAGGNILDADVDENVNILAATAILNAVGSIGANNALVGPAASNVNALDTRVGTLSTRSGAAGTYIQEIAAGGSLDIGQVGAITANIAAVKEVKFNSSESSVSLTGQNTTAASQEDAESLGVFKLVVRDGILSLKDGPDADVDAVSASGDILLGASSDININGRVASVNGSVTVNSQASTILSNEVSATSGTVYIGGSNVSLQSAAKIISDQDILVRASTSIILTGDLKSTNGQIVVSGSPVMIDNPSAIEAVDVSIESNGFLTFNGSITATGKILIFTTQDLIMTGIATSSGDSVTVNTLGDARLGRLEGDRVSVISSKSIFDNNASTANIVASSASLFANNGTIGDRDAPNPTINNPGALDLQVGTLAALASGNIYLDELATGGNLTIGGVAAETTSVEANANLVSFNSSPAAPSTASISLNVNALSDVQSLTGAVYVLVRDGSLTVTDGTDVDSSGIQAVGEVRIRTNGDINVNSGITSTTSRVTALSTAGDVVVNAAINANGPSLLEAARDVTISNQVRSNGSDLTIFASDDLIINYTAGVAIDSAGGSLLLLVQNGNNSGNDGIVMASGSSIASGNGQVIVAAFNSGIQLARVSGSVVGLLATGAITDANDNVTPNTLNVVANAAVIQANTVGAPNTGNLDPNANGNAIDTQVSTLSISTDGGIYVREVDGVTINSVVASAVRVNQLGGNGFASMSLPNVFSSSGVIKIQSVTGDLIVGASVVTSGSSDVLLEALAGNGDIIANQVVTSRGGDVNLRAGDDIDLNANVSTSGLGSVHLLAANGNLDAINGVDMTSAATVSATGGGVRIVAQNGGDILLSRVNGSSVSLIAANSIIDNNDSVTPHTLNIQANSLQMVATNGLIGNSDPSSTPAIDTQVTTLAARSALGIHVREVDGVTVESVATAISNVRFRSTEDSVVDTLEDLSTTNGGPIKIQAVNGNITINAGSLGGAGVSANGSGDILLEAMANDGSILINGAVISTIGASSAILDGHIEINAGDTVTSSAAITAADGSVYVHSADINLLDGGNLNSNLGLHVVADRSISIASDINSQQDVLIRNGLVTVTSTGSIVGANIGVQASSLSLAGTMDAAGGVAVSASSVTMTGDALIDGASVAMLVTSDIALGRVVATNTNIITTSGNITDNNGALLNVQASTLSMVAMQGSIGASDLPSDPDSNRNAIDIQVGILSATARDSIYFQQSTGNVTIGGAPTVNAAVNPAFFRVRFNDSETTGFANFGLFLGGSSDLTASGPIKVKVDAGTLTVTNGVDADGIGVTTSSGDILLWGADGLLVQSRVVSTLGDITFRTNNVVSFSANGSIEAGGTALFIASSIAGNWSVSASNDLVIQTDGDLNFGGTLSSVSGTIGLISTNGSVIQNASISNVKNFYANAAVNFTMAPGISIDVTENAVIRAGNDLNLRMVQANNVFLGAERIIDADLDEKVNIKATNAILNAGVSIGSSHLNPNPNSNIHAIDLDVDVISTRSGSGGTYLQQIASGGGIVVGSVGKFVVTEAAREVKFNSSNPDVIWAGVSGIVDVQENSESQGVFKIVTENGSITVNDGNDADSLGIQAASDILIESRNQADTGADTIVNALISSVAGHVTLSAADDVHVNARVSTGGTGSLLITANNNFADAVGVQLDGVNVNGLLSTGDGDLLIDSLQDIRQNGFIASIKGDIGLVAARNLVQTAIGDVTTESGNALFEATNGQWVMDSDTILSVGGGSFIGLAKDDISLGLITMTNVAQNRIALQSLQGSIQDGNAAAGNIIEGATGSNTTLSLRAAQKIGDVGGGANADDLAIDLSVDSVAASASSGVFLREIASGKDLVVGTVAEVKLTIDGVRRARFDSSVLVESLTRSSSGLEDLTTTNNGAISIVVENGTIVIEGGSDSTGVSAHGTGNVLISALNQSATGADIQVNGMVQSDSGFITLIAADDIHTASEVRSNGAGDISLIARNNQTDATIGRVDGVSLGRSVTTTSGNLFLVSQADIDTTNSGVTISGIELTVNSVGYTHLNSTNVAVLSASVGGVGKLDNAFEQTNSNANNRGDDFFTGMNPRNATNGDQLPTQTATDFQNSAAAASSNYRFQERLAEQYALFIKNGQDLTIRSIVANSNDAPHVYVETINANNLTVDGAVATINRNPSTGSGGIEGAIVLVAGGELELSTQGSLVTVANYPGGVRTQVINQIGPDGDTVLVTEYHGGEGAAGFAQPISTRIGNPDIFGSGARDNDPEIDAFQRVVLNYGSAGELGFDVYIAYADGVLQRFYRASDIGVFNDTTFDVNSRVTDFNSYSSAPRGTPVNAFTRTTLMTQEFVIDNIFLPTVVSVRRADDFFLFENASATDIAQIRDLTVETVEILDVVSITAEIKALPLPEDVPLILPPVLSISPNPEEFVNVILPNSGVELKEIIERQTEISIYQVYFEDLDNDGYADDEELPKDAEVLEYAEIDGAEAKEKKLLAPRTKVKLGSVVAGFGSVTNQEIEAIKAGFLNDPNQPAGAYAIVKKDALSNEYVLEVFSVRDGQDDSSGGNDEAPLLQRKEQSSDLDKGADESKPMESGDGVQPGNKQPEPDTLSQWSHSSGVELLAAAMLLNRRKQRADRRVLESMADEIAPSTGINRSARRSRRIAAILEQTPLNR